MICKINDFNEKEIKINKKCFIKFKLTIASTLEYIKRSPPPPRDPLLQRHLWECEKTWLQPAVIWTQVRRNQGEEKGTALYPPRPPSLALSTRREQAHVAALHFLIVKWTHTHLPYAVEWLVKQAVSVYPHENELSYYQCTSTVLYAAHSAHVSRKQAHMMLVLKMPHFATCTVLFHESHSFSPATLLSISKYVKKMT